MARAISPRSYDGGARPRPRCRRTPLPGRVAARQHHLGQHERSDDAVRRHVRRRHLHAERRRPPTLRPQSSIDAQAIQIQAGATIDISGGGVLAGAGFVSGRGGSTDILQSPLLALTPSGVVTGPPPATNQVFAIVPGLTGSVAPPTATATPFAGPLPAAGDQITLGGRRPGPAGRNLHAAARQRRAAARRIPRRNSRRPTIPSCREPSVLATDRIWWMATAASRTPLSTALCRSWSPSRPAPRFGLDAQYDETSYADFG